MITLYGKYHDKPLTKFGMTIFNEADFAVVMLDDSMKSIIPLGAWAILQKNNSDTFIYGQPYYIQTRDFSIIRVVRKSEHSDSELILEPTNSEKYDNIILNREAVINTFFVCGAINSFYL